MRTLREGGRLNKKFEDWLEKKTYSILIKSNQFNIKHMKVDLGEEFLKKMSKTYMKILLAIFKIIGVATFSLTMLWLLPVHFKVSYEKIYAILLVVIFIQIRFIAGKIPEQKKENDEKEPRMKEVWARVKEKNIPQKPKSIKKQEEKGIFAR